LSRRLHLNKSSVAVVVIVVVTEEVTVLVKVLVTVEVMDVVCVVEKVEVPVVVSVVVKVLYWISNDFAARENPSPSKILNLKVDTF